MTLLGDTARATNVLDLGKLLRHVLLKVARDKSGKTLPKYCHAKARDLTETQLFSSQTFIEEQLEMLET